MKVLAFFVDPNDLKAVKVDLNARRKIYESTVVQTVTTAVADQQGFTSSTALNFSPYSPEHEGEVPRSFTVRELKEKGGMFLVWPENASQATVDEIETLMLAIKLTIANSNQSLLEKEEELEKIRSELEKLHIKRDSSSSINYDAKKDLLGKIEKLEEKNLILSEKVEKLEAENIILRETILSHESTINSLTVKLQRQEKDRDALQFRQLLQEYRIAKIVPVLKKHNTNYDLFYDDAVSGLTSEDLNEIGISKELLQITCYRKSGRQKTLQQLGNQAAHVFNNESIAEAIVRLPVGSKRNNLSILFKSLYGEIPEDVAFSDEDEDEE